MRRGWIFLCFFFSGVAALIFEQVWARILALIFGTSALALSTVLASFMAGLATGSAIGGKIADRLRRPLLVAAAIELGVGVLGLLLPFVLSYRDLFAIIGGDSFFWASLARFAICLLVLGIPTTLMGATLPLLARAVLRYTGELKRSGARIGHLYSANTAGAFFGALAAGFWLLPQWGLRATNLCAVLCEFGVAALLYGLARRPESEPTGDDLLAALDDELLVVPPSSTRRVVIFAYATSGALGMAYEVLWTRALAMVIGSSVYSFTIILSAFLWGIALGASLGGRILRRISAVDALAVIHFALALTAAFTTVTFDQLPGLFLHMLQRSSLEAGSVMSLHFTLAMLAILPSATLLGTTFPLTMQATSDSLESVGRSTGRTYAWNTVGSIFGAFAGGFVLLPLLGLRKGLLLGIAVSLFLAALLVCFSSVARRTRALASCSLVVLLIVGIRVLPHWDLVDLTVGVFRISLARDYLLDPNDRPELLFYKDGLSTTVSVERWGGDLLALKNNGKVDASSRDDMPTQIMVGALPLLLHPDYSKRPLRVLLVGFASGATAGAILQAQISHLDVVELEEATISASRFFEGVNNRPLDDPRLALHIDDGRSFLQRTRTNYDVIINEPSNPWLAGVASLFTVEYFRLAQQRLAPNGIFCSWAQLYELALPRVQSIYRAFAEVFSKPYVFAAEDLSSDTFLVAGRDALTIDYGSMARAFADLRFASEMRRADVRSPNDVAAMLLLGSEEMRDFTKGITPNNDDNARVEFGAPLDLLTFRQNDSTVSRVYQRYWSESSVLRKVTGFSDLGALAVALVRHGRRLEAERLAADPRCLQAKQLLHWLTRDGDHPSLPLLEPPKTPSGLSATEQQRFALDNVAIEKHVGAKRLAQAYQLISAWPESWIDQSGSDFQLLWGALLFQLGETRQAKTRLAALAEDTSLVDRRPVLLYYLGRSYYQEGDYKKGTDALLSWFVAQPTASQ